MIQGMASISISDGLNFIPYHINGRFPRKISTKTTKNVRIKVDSKEKALASL
jgi:hypothetical protein